MLKRFRQFTPDEAKKLQEEVAKAKALTESTVSGWEAEATLVEQQSRQEIAYFKASSRMATAAANTFEAMSAAMKNISFQFGRIDKAKEEISQISPTAADDHMLRSSQFAQKYLPRNRKP